MTNLKPEKKFRHISRHRVLILEKGKESLYSILPMTLIVLFLCCALLPVPTDTLLVFLFGAVMLVFGLGLFNLGSDLAMTPIGNHIGSAVTHSRKLWMIIGTTFLIGIFVTIAEPDLQVLANQVSGVPNLILILFVAIGVGIFLTVAMLRILLHISIRKLLTACYLLVFVLAFLIPKDFLAVAFDSGGVTTGPMTVPFIMSLGVGVSSIRNDRNADNDSFGLVALSSVGPILAVMILALFYHPQGDSSGEIQSLSFNNTREIFSYYLSELPQYVKEVGLAILPVISFFLLFQFTILRLNSREMSRIIAGLLYTFIGLVLFLLGANAGFMPMGSYLGEALGHMNSRWLLIPIGMIIGYFAVNAEPAVHVLSKQVYQITAGAIPQNTLSKSLSVSVAVSIGLAMLRILLRIPILYFLIPGYAIALLLIPFVPTIFTSIAFDSGGVASGPLTATFLLPMALGCCRALGGDSSTDAFGVVAMVAMTPLITIQVLGLIAKIKDKNSQIEVSSSSESEEIIE